MKALEYMERAEELKKMLDSAGGAAGASGGTAAMTGERHLREIARQTSSCLWSQASQMTKTPKRKNCKERFQVCIAPAASRTHGTLVSMLTGCHHRCHPI